MEHGVLKKLAPAVCFLLCSVFAAAQQDSMGKSKSSNKPHIQGIVQAGLLAGASGRDLQVQTIVSVQHNTWSAGIGVGLDYYFVRGIPLFVDVRKQFKTSIPLFVYADAGWHLPWRKENEVTTGLHTNDFKNGFYYDAGLGWSFEPNTRNKILLSAGYSGKSYTEIQRFTFDSPVTKLEYTLRRISIKAGFQF